MEERQGDWIQTYTGKKFWPLDPRVEDIDIKDIAHALSLTCRFGGHCNEFYSVAQHSVIVSQLVEESNAFVALLHDAPEAYIGDVVRPFKKSLATFGNVEENLERVIYHSFGISEFSKEMWKEADNIALYTEMRDLMGKPPEAWEDWTNYQSTIPRQKIVPLGPRESEQLFLRRYEQLTSV